MNKFLNILTLVIVAGFLTSCASVMRTADVAPAYVNVNLDPGTYKITGSTTATSTLDSYLGGLIKVVDGDKLIFLGLKTFEDQYAFYGSQQGGLFGRISPADRAYYKALAATPNADAVLPKAMARQVSGFPVLYRSEEVSFKGKAIQYNTGQ